MQMLLSLKEARETFAYAFMQRHWHWWTPIVAPLHHLLMVVARRIVFGRWIKLDWSKELGPDSQVHVPPSPPRCDVCKAAYGMCAHSGGPFSRYLETPHEDAILLQPTEVAMTYTTLVSSTPCASARSCSGSASS